MLTTDLKLDGPKYIQGIPFYDARGLFCTMYDKEDFEKAGLPTNWVLDNISYNKSKGTIRGLHFQIGEFAQAKLIKVVSGAIWDIIVDIRKGSPTYGEHEEVILEDWNYTWLYVPRGFAHGFITVCDDTTVEYKVDNIYSPEHESGLRFDDPDLDIDIGIEDFLKLNKMDNPIMSEKDKNWGAFKDF